MQYKKSYFLYSYKLKFGKFLKLQVLSLRISDPDFVLPVFSGKTKSENPLVAIILTYIFSIQLLPDSVVNMIPNVIINLIK